MNNKQNGVSRLLRLVWKEYKIEMLVVILAIIGSALASVKGTLFLQTLIDDYIVPLTESNYPDFAPLASALFKIAMIYILGILCSYIYNRIMVNVSQGTMKIIRIKLFNHMQSLPIQYFDSHSHGDIMSIYTNDTDTLRQFLSQSVPQLFNSIITIVSIFVAMITLNIPLTIITLVMVAIMLVVAKNAAALSSKYFNQQQNNLGKLNAVQNSNRQKHQPLNSYVSLSDENESDHLEGSWSEDPEALIIDQESTRTLEREITKVLSPMENKVLDYYLRGYGYVKIAEIMGKTPKSIDNALQRIRGKIRNFSAPVQK